MVDGRGGITPGRDVFDLTGRSALVTGGNGGLGLAMAQGLARHGATVAVTGRNPGKNQAVKGRLGSRSLVLEADVADEDSIVTAVDTVVETFGTIDILVNNAGSFSGGPVTELSLDAWRSVLDSHLTGAFLCSKHVARHMRAVGAGGKIINVGSMFSLFGPPDFADYAAAKSGILGLTRALAVELAPDRIQVNAILPGWYETDLTRGMPASEAGRFIRDKTPAGRWGDPQDLVGPVVFLSSSASDFVTGAILPVDGGYSVGDRPSTLRD